MPDGRYRRGLGRPIRRRRPVGSGGRHPLAASPALTPTGHGPTDGPGLEAELVRILQGRRAERHLIALQDYPDPDAIASALAHQHLSREHRIETAIVFAGELSHHQNRKLADLLGVELHHLRDGFELRGWDGAVFIDNQGATCPFLVRQLRRFEVPPILIVDHHEGDTLLDPEAHLVEPVGATSTLYAEFFRDGLLGVAPASAEGRRTASGLLFGVLTDTQQLSLGSSRDRRAVSWLTPYSDSALLREVVQEPMPDETMEIISRALATRILRRGFTFAGVGYLPAAHRDALPQAATWLLAQGGAHTAVVFGIVRDWRLQETITGSLRTMLPSPSPHEFLREALGTSDDGEILSGGRAFAGGFEIPVGMSTRGSPMRFQLVRWAYYEQMLLGRLLQAAENTSLHERPGEPEAGGESPGGSEYPDLFDHRSPVWQVLHRNGLEKPRGD